MCSLSFLSLVSVACAAGGAAPAPAIVADGAGLLITAGNGGNVDIDGEDITFVVGAGKAAKRVSVLTMLNQLAQALDNIDIGSSARSPRPLEWCLNEADEAR